MFIRHVSKPSQGMVQECAPRGYTVSNSTPHWPHTCCSSQPGPSCTSTTCTNYCHVSRVPGTRSRPRGWSPSRTAPPRPSAAGCSRPRPSPGPRSCGPASRGRCRCRGGGTINRMLLLARYLQRPVVGAVPHQLHAVVDGDVLLEAAAVEHAALVTAPARGVQGDGERPHLTNHSSPHS